MAQPPSAGFLKSAASMTAGDDETQIRLGRIRHGNRGAKRPKSFVAEVMRAAKKAGHVGRTFTQGGRGNGRSTFGRGRRAVLSLVSRAGHGHDADRPLTT